MDFTSVLEPFSLETANVSVASSNLFTAPVFPKIVVVGLSGHQEDSLKQFKEILSKALDNLFVIEFSEQVFLVLHMKIDVYCISIFLTCLITKPLNLFVLVIGRIKLKSPGCTRSGMNDQPF